MNLSIEYISKDKSKKENPHAKQKMQDIMLEKKKTNSTNLDDLVNDEDNKKAKKKHLNLSIEHRMRMDHTQQLFVFIVNGSSLVLRKFIGSLQQNYWNKKTYYLQMYGKRYVIAKFQNNSKNNIRYHHLIICCMVCFLLQMQKEKRYINMLLKMF